MTDLRKFIKISFPDNGVSIFMLYLCSYIIYVIIIFKLFLVGVGRPPGGYSG